MSKVAFSVALSLLFVSFSVARGEIPFAFTADGGAIPAIDTDDSDEGFSIFTLFMHDAQFPDGIPEILSLKLELTGLTHSFPDDLDIYLLDPFGAPPLEIMTDMGGRFALPGKGGVTLIFDDFAKDLPPDEGQFPSGITTYRPEGTEPGHGGGLNNFVDNSGGTGAWRLMVIDDSPRDDGALTSWTLSGTTVPEPVTLALLALGAMTVLRRRRA